MSLWIAFLHRGKPRVLLQAYISLNMNSAFGTLLQLAVDIVGDFEPLFQVLTYWNSWIIVGYEPIFGLHEMVFRCIIILQHRNPKTTSIKFEKKEMCKFEKIRKLIIATKIRIISNIIKKWRLNLKSISTTPH